MRAIKILLGGSPCTFWSIAQRNNRETIAEGMGWELFKNYLIAKEKFKPDFFLYENNKSAAQAIKEQICKELGVDLMYCDSALVSAQRRQRFYCFNWNAEQPIDRGVLLKDIIEGEFYGLYSDYNNSITHDKARTIGTGIGTQRSTTHQQVILYPVGIKKIAKGGQKDEIYEITFPDGSHRIDSVRKYVRNLTPVECERLQTLPDGYTAKASNAQRYKQLGNGWTAEIILHLLKQGLQDIPRDTEIVALSLSTMGLQPEDIVSISWGLPMSLTMRMKLTNTLCLWQWTIIRTLFNMAMRLQSETITGRHLKHAPNGLTGC